MAKLAETSRIGVPFISDPVPGMELEYEVRAEKGRYGDFPGQFEFELHGRWLVAARIVRAVTAGHQTEFEVYEDEGSRDEPLMRASGVVLPRLIGRNLPPSMFGAHPFQGGYATNLDQFRIDGQKPNNEGRRRLIPARNIHPGSLRLILEASLNDPDHL